ncbi:hypothetical protein Kpol_2000p38 [Vanderwaltozyma polyspora DSM 70294]|uniref:Large ribosomal subunit protein mL46 n=1 Tax=Vanderwaltozyma polyspora (strain ATCC 22028 / DSM 70294 / BCRC 21397 / CBS 2163 / NBRC 10782 / NRRL Y-8283 / UCD 57-17) TaxID=436907 RepID=A7TF48_VANPO|nr:uncharacterized protein Kpol_2000p38 [Vanderwaltozyma polyspora DSM 70294]EDO19073.1 hypothetical protein Kpol_2000p38 [Vanderwaltozyma polyspora DSM 70294]
MLTFRRGMATTAKKAADGAILSSIVLSRNPIVTPDLTEMESNYYKYQSGLERRLMWTFPDYFYFKKGTLSQNKFANLQKGPISKLPGVWFPKGLPDIKQSRERSQKQNVLLPKGASNEGPSKEEDLSRPVVPNSRITEADKKGDISSIERKLSRTLYLLVKNKGGKWTFPKFEVSDNSGLHIRVETGLREIGGEEINTWTVSRTPAAVMNHKNGSNEFFIKSHILGGKFELQDPSKTLVTDFAWLTKEEIKDLVDKSYYKGTEFMLSEI